MASAGKKTTTEYKHVYKTTVNGKVKYQISILRDRKGSGLSYTRKNFDDLREAAVAVDKYLIGKGLEPVNVLKRKE